MSSHRLDCCPDHPRIDVDGVVPVSSSANLMVVDCYSGQSFYTVMNFICVDIPALPVIDYCHSNCPSSVVVSDPTSLVLLNISMVHTHSILHSEINPSVARTMSSSLAGFCACTDDAM